jgi:hypothetical protein
MAIERTFGHQVMRAELRRLHSPDVLDLVRYAPKTGEDFGFLLQILVGPSGGEGEESFDIMVCTLGWLKQTHEPSDIVIGRHYLFVFEYDYGRLNGYLEQYCANCSGESWLDVAQQLGRLGKWEFEDYRPT